MRLHSVRGAKSLHLEAYLNEMAFRFNNHKNLFLFRDTLLKMIEADKCRVQGVPAPALEEKHSGASFGSLKQKASSDYCTVEIIFQDKTALSFELSRRHGLT